MVRLEEVQDEAFVADQPGPVDDEAEWDTDSESDASSTTSHPEPDETLYERLAALQDIIPPNSRRQLSSTLDSTYSWGSWGLQGGLKLAWQISVSVLLLVTPFALVCQEDAMLAMEEKQMQLTQDSNEIMTPGATSSAQQAL